MGETENVERTMMRRSLAGLAAGTLLLAGVVALGSSPASSGSAPILVVDTTVDDGALDACTAAADDCSLRGAFERTQSAHVGQPVTIEVPAGEYLLTEQLYLYNANVTVNGAGVGATTVRADTDENLVRHLELNVDGELDVTLTDMTFSDGFESGGGSILSRGGATLTLERMHFVGNRVRGDGGAVLVAGAPPVVDTLVVDDSTFVGNGASGTGGAIAVSEGETATITNSTFHDNHAAFGGAVFVGTFDVEDDPATATFTHVTLAGNTASGFQGDASIAGGAIAVGGGASATVTASIIEASAEGEPLLQPAAVGDPVASCYVADGGTLASGGRNVVDDDTCNATEPTDQPDTAAGVGALGDNGGPTFTMALTAASPAVDAAGASCSVPDDQRGVARPQDGDGDGTNGCDSGAFELAAGPDDPDDPAEPPAALPVTAAPRFTG